MERGLTLLFVLICSSLVLLPPAAVAEQRTAISATEATGLVMQKVKVDALYDAWTNTGCLSFLEDEFVAYKRVKYSRNSE